MRFPEKDSTNNDDDRVPEQVGPTNGLTAEEAYARREETRRLRQARVDLLQYRQQLVNIISRQQEAQQKMKSDVNQKSQRLNQLDEACSNAQRYIDESQRRSNELQTQLQQMKAELARLQAEREAKQSKLAQVKQEKRCSCDKCSKTAGGNKECSH